MVLSVTDGVSARGVLERLVSIDSVLPGGVFQSIVSTERCKSPFLQSSAIRRGKEAWTHGVQPMVSRNLHSGRLRGRSAQRLPLVLTSSIQSTVDEVDERRRSTAWEVASNSWRRPH